MTTTQKTILITGANKGLGHEAARRLLAAGHSVWVGARDEQRGRAAAEQLGARFVQLDVTDDASIAAAVAQIDSLDVLINNAGIVASMRGTLGESGDEVAAVLATNTVGVVRVTQAFLPLLERSREPVIVNVSSGLGSFVVTADPSRVEHGVHNLGYSASKAAVNMLTTQWAKALPAFRVNAVDPGYTATDLNGHSGPQTVEQGTDAIVRLAQIGADGPTGTFSDAAGPVAW
ncbi:SDR family NAD(P)-dependent oxidoreductase [Conexibacter sp. JD483]|uniref:SDR family NAD(P)-dependent oxidoreductase n=1 Tax=unclassified Conexibacter TaxID=2627773 RepID=UPI002724CF81|nr:MULTISPECIES: SDR family NAD(P)-dependent oxidoreductase [unclassified Conexibacter]MDO8186061.1 SDR family NAD(P)-dependent oxidoreductase [Conexibacter sp. CPCC 205706]MDO8199551.1 SDR family NAD(P)-dependent oxidoreductase [Conexibacter sp. CPCC 205762]MDR9372013.1 SDR family NAD(P)-dependent oxidoreductase [Conexibacter sp. JD483]